VHVVTSQARVRGAAFFVLVNATGWAAVKNAAQTPGSRPGAESFVLAPGRQGSVPARRLGSDVLGYVYGLLELTERASSCGFRSNSARGAASFGKTAMKCAALGAIFEQVETKRGSTTRISVGYLDCSLRQFNRFCLAFGLEYDFPRA